MCDPVTATTLAVVSAVTSVVSTGAEIAAQAHTAKAQAKAINSQLAVTQEESRRAASAELFDQMRATHREEARIRAASGEAGLDIGSASIEGLLADSAMQNSLQGSRTLANMESRNKASMAETVSELSRVQKPTALGAGLQLGTAALNGWAGIQRAKLTTQQAKTG